MRMEEDECRVISILNGLHTAWMDAWSLLGELATLAAHLPTPPTGGLLLHSITDKWPQPGRQRLNLINPAASAPERIVNRPL